MTIYDLAQPFIGLKEFAGERDNPYIRWAHSLCTIGEQPDEVPWCSSFLNSLAWLLRLPRSRSALARSWLKVGKPVLGPTDTPQLGDVVILKRGRGEQPGPENMTAPGHVGLFAGFDGDHVLSLGGNQNDEVNISPYDKAKILGIRRLA